MDVLLQEILQGNKRQNVFEVKSLALDLDQKTKTATVDFESLPSRLPPDKNEWTFDLPEECSNQNSDGSDEDDVVLAPQRLTIDTHFKGLTILRSFEKLSDHKVEWVVQTTQNAHG